MRYKALILLAFVAFPAAAAPRTAPDPQPEPQNQSIVNTSESNVKDFAVVPAEPAAADAAINTTPSNIKNSFRLAPGDPTLIATPIEIRFADRGGYEEFAAGRIPLALVLRNAASGQTIRFDPLILDLGRAAGRDSVRLDVRIDKVDSALLARGCFETATTAQPRGDVGVAIAIVYSPCEPGSAPSAQRVVNPIPGIGVVVKKPGGSSNLVVATGPSEVGGGAEARLAARSGSARQLVVPVSTAKGAGSPKANGF